MFPTMTTFRRLPAAYPNPRFFPRTIHGSLNRHHRDAPNPVSHGAENYFVDGDETPPPNTTLYKVDGTSDAAQSAYEPPSGASAGTDEYRTLSNDEPYDVPDASPDVKLRYGGMKRYMEDKGAEMSKAWEGPQGTGRWGRKPEGRT